MAILLTGADTPIGAKTAGTLIDAGYDVIGVGQEASQLADWAAQLGERFCPCVVNVGDVAAVEAALAGLPEAFADIDCVIHNATLNLDSTTVDKADFANWQVMMHNHVMGLAHLTQKALPQMLARGRGDVILLTSVSGTYPAPNAAFFGATQAFVRQFGLNLRADLADKGIRISTVELGLCDDEAGHVSADDVAQTVLWLYQRPPHLNVNRIELMPTVQTFAPLTVHQSGAKEGKNAIPKKGLFAKLAGYLKG